MFEWVNRRTRKRKEWSTKMKCRCYKETPISRLERISNALQVRYEYMQVEEFFWVTMDLSTNHAVELRTNAVTPCISALFISSLSLFLWGKPNRYVSLYPFYQNGSLCWLEEATYINDTRHGKKLCALVFPMAAIVQYSVWPIATFRIQVMDE